MTSNTAQSVYGFSAPLLDGQTTSLSAFHGHVLLIVNTASQCGYTPQYAALESLFSAYKDRGLTVLGFPCNQFGHQEPGTQADIASFCQRNFGVSFPLFAKIDVNGPHTHPLYQYLKKCKPGIFATQRIKWNFTKFLVDRPGQVVGRYAPSTKPQALTATIERLLNSQ